MNDLPQGAVEKSTMKDEMKKLPQRLNFSWRQLLWARQCDTCAFYIHKKICSVPSEEHFGVKAFSFNHWKHRIGACMLLRVVASVCRQTAQQCSFREGCQRNNWQATTRMATTDKGGSGVGIDISGRFAASLLEEGSLRRPDTHVMAKCYPNDAQMVCEWHPNDSQMISKWCLNDALNDVQMMHKWCQ